MFTELLERVRKIIGLTAPISIEVEETLNEIIGNFVQMVNLYIGSDELPVELEWIVVETSVSRWNRRSAEGYESESIGEISINYLEDIMTPYYPYMETYKSKNSKIRFL